MVTFFHLRLNVGEKSSSNCFFLRIHHLPACVVGQFSEGKESRQRCGAVSRQFFLFWLLSQDMVLEPQGQPFINGCFNWMMNQVFT